MPFLLLAFSLYLVYLQLLSILVAVVDLIALFGCVYSVDLETTLSASLSSSSSTSITSALNQLNVEHNSPVQNQTPNLGSGSGVTTDPELATSLPLKPGQKRKAANASPQWDHFTRCKIPGTEDIDPIWCTCNYCQERVRCCTKKNGTSSMISHSRKCPNCPLFEATDPRQSKLNRDNVFGAIAYHSFNPRRCDQKCIEYIIRDELPFRHVEKDGFKAFAYELQPRWIPLNRRQIASGIWDRYQLEKGILMSQLAATETRISITTDTWTSIQNINYLVLTAHFMDVDWVLHKRIINFCVITSHKGEEIGRVLENCLRQWGITKVFTITVDNASANDLAVVHMKKRLKSYKTLMFDGEYLHLRCCCHIINLIVKDGIKELEGGIAAIWHCVKYIRSSSQRLDKFREFSVLEHLRANANVPLDVITRWNSTYLMLEAALKYEVVFGRMADEDSQFQAYFKEKDKGGQSRVGPPKEADWRNAEAFVVFLKKFYDATIKLSAWKSVTSNLVFAEMIGLQVEIDKKMRSEDEVLRRVATSMKAKFNKYYGNFEAANKIIMIANVLDPRYKLQWAKKSLERVKASAAAIQSINDTLRIIQMQMYQEYKGKDGNQPADAPTDFEGDDMMDLTDMDESQAEIARDCMQERMAQHHDSICNEVDQYLSDRYVSLFIKNFDVAVWWKGNESTYPILAKLAKDIFAIPCSTVASENAFSLGSRIVDPFRASLTPKMVEALVCTSDWMKGEPPKFYKDPSQDEIEMYQALEEFERVNGVHRDLEAGLANLNSVHGSPQTSSRTEN